MRSLLVLALAAFILSGCGGVADCRATHELNVHVSRHGRPLSERPVSVAMRVEAKAPFMRSQHTATDPAGRAHAAFETMWSAAFVVIPPLGLVPPHPPKPGYAVTIGGKEIVVSPDTPGCTYRWHDGSWHTEASIDLP